MMCDNDPKFYQTCGLARRNTIENNANVFCADFICQLTTSGKNTSNVASRFLDIATSVSYCDGKQDCQNTNLDEEDCSEENAEKTTLPYSGNTIRKSLLCNGICDVVTRRVNIKRPHCEDEILCNEIMYGKWCDTNDEYETQSSYTAPHDICDGHLRWEDCPELESDEYCKRKTNFTCLHHKTSELVPIFNYTRCAALSIDKKAVCADFKDQTNCSDPARVALQCPINGFMSNVSTYAICAGTPLCDDGIENECPLTSKLCQLHKHKLCDGVFDCVDHSDEVNPYCQMVTKGICARRLGNGTALTLPLAWISDGTKDCLDGRDEGEHWPFCGKGLTHRYVTSNEACENVFICPDGATRFIEYDQLCDGIETCGNENMICRASRRLPIINTKVLSSKDQLEKFLPYCVKGIDKQWQCTSKNFTFPQHEFFGVNARTQLLMPENMFPSCDDMFGEYYLYSSCTGRCPNTTCPLKNIPRYEHCPNRHTNRVGTIANNDYLTFFLKSHGAYHNQFFVCDNLIECVDYSQVCNLIDDCGDRSDERNCTNHFQCSGSELYIPKSSKCDEAFDCLDLSDECNSDCTKQIIEGSLLKWSSWMIGSTAMLANVFVVVMNGFKLKKMRTGVALTNISLISLIGLGDLLIGGYMLAISFSDAQYKQDYCFKQREWLTSRWCSILGIISTTGSQVSLTSMTVLSVIRVHGILQSMRIPGPVSRKSVLFTVFIVSTIILSGIVTAVLPLQDFAQDFFVNGLSFEEKLRIFIGLPNKVKLMEILEQYYGRIRKSRKLSWQRIISLSEEMFSNDEMATNLFQYTKKVKFYGNDGVCLFKYFVNEEDPQRAFVWTILIIYFVCFLVILFSYSLILMESIISSRASGNNSNRMKKDGKLKKKIFFVIATDFCCWVPFIAVCACHYYNVINATSWYSLFSMIILPINSVINPLLYNNFLSGISSRVKLHGLALISSISSHLQTFRSKTNENTQPLELIETNKEKKHDDVDSRTCPKTIEEKSL